MNRQQLRSNERERIKNQKWFQGWSPSQMEFHKKMVSECVDEVERITEEVLDSCYIAAMVERLDLNLNKCIEVAKIADKNMNEVKEIIKKDGEMYFNMLKDEKLRVEIREEAKGMIEQGQVMSRGVNELKKVYKVPVKDLMIIWAEGKQELKDDKELKEVIKKHLPEELPYTLTEKEIEASRGITIEELLIIININ